jgi:sulfate adenylyltransferase subunit 2
MPSIYFAHEREVFERDGMLLAVNEFVRCARTASEVEERPCATAPSAT